MTPDARNARIPDHVVHRDFPGETVILNLETGKYHGLNATAGRMFAALGQSGSVGTAATVLATEFGVSREQIECDLRDLCRTLADRGLLEFDDLKAA